MLRGTARVTELTSELRMVLSYLHFWAVEYRSFEFVESSDDVQCQVSGLP